tara:strand:+ start:868 stop:1290 length:423 start_codon:yes stop_codon:yes gene_type:complete
MSFEKCPCNSSKYYQDCCQRYHKDPSKVPTTEHLLRARYTAFVYKLPSFIKQTMIEPALQAYDENFILHSPIQWQSLQILSKDKGSEFDTHGSINFIVTCLETKEATKPFSVKETSLFKRVNGIWVYEKALSINNNPVSN